MDDMISLPEAAAILGYRGRSPARNVSSLIAQGKLCAQNIDGVLYVSRAEVEQWLRSRQRPAVAELPVSSDPAPDDLITPGEAAQILGFAVVAGVSKMIARGRLRAWRYTGPPNGRYTERNAYRRVSRAEVEALRETRRAEAEKRRKAAERTLKILAS